MDPNSKKTNPGTFMRPAGGGGSLLKSTMVPPSPTGSPLNQNTTAPSAVPSAPVPTAPQEPNMVRQQPMNATGQVSSADENMLILRALVEKLKHNSKMVASLVQPQTQTPAPQPQQPQPPQQLPASMLQQLGRV